MYSGIRIERDDVLIFIQEKELEKKYIIQDF